MSSEKDDPQAIPFITLSPNGKFDLAPEAREFLGRLHSRRLGVISIAGKYRTGKSYFINKVLLNGGPNKPRNGFAVGHTNLACTKGLLLWNRVIKASDLGGDPTLDLLIVDTEGFDATDQSANHNTRIFLFAVLLSSLFIYNSKLTIDERAIESLELVIKLAQNLKFRESGEESADDIAGTFPAFIWVIRDFALDKKNEKGEAITDKQYLEKALEETKGITPEGANKNRIRKAIKKFFPRRDCMTFSRPAEREEDLRNLDLLPDAELRDKFRTELRKGRETIFKGVKPKLFNGAEVSGPVFFELAQALVQIINSGQVPNIEQIGFYASQETLRKGGEESLRLADQLIAEAVQKGRPLGEVRAEIEEKVFRHFKDNSFADKKSFKEAKAKLVEKINSVFSKRRAEQTGTLRKTVQTAFDNQAFSWRDKIKSKQIGDIESLKRELDEFQGKLAEEHGSSPEVVALLVSERMRVDRELCADFFERRKEEERQKAAHIEEIRTHLDANVAEVGRKTQQVADLSEEVTRLGQLNKQLQATIEELEKKCGGLEDRLEEERGASQKQRLAHDLRLQQLELEWTKRVDEVAREGTAAVRAKEQELHDLRKETAVKGSSAESYKRELLRRDKEVSDFEQRVADLKAERRTMDDRLADMEGKAVRDAEEIHRLKDTLAAKNSEVADLKMAKHRLDDQVAFLNSRIEDMKDLYERVIPAMGEKPAEAVSTPQLAELTQTNKQMLGFLQKFETKNKILKEKCQSLKQFRQICQECDNVQCKRCSKLIHVNYFLAHVRDCSGPTVGRQDSAWQQSTWGTSQTKDDRAKLGTSTSASCLWVKIKDSKTVSNGKEHYIEYHVSVFSEDEKERVIRKKYKDFTNLILDLKKELPGVILPKSTSKISGTSLATDLSQLNKTSAGDRKRVLEECLNELARMPEVRSRGVFRRFLEIDEPKQGTGLSQTISSQPADRLEAKRDSISDYDSRDDFLEDSQDDSNESNPFAPRENESNQANSSKHLSKGPLNSFNVAGLSNTVLNKVTKSVSLVGKGSH